MLKRALIYGALVAVLGAVWTLIEYALGFHGEKIETGQYTGYVSLIFPIVGIVLAIQAAKKADTGAFTFGDGFKQGLATTAVFSVLGAIFFYLYHTAINPRYADLTRDLGLKKFQEQGYSGRELEQARTVLEASTSPVALIFGAIIGSLIVGLIISAIAAAVLRRKAAAAADGYGDYAAS